MTKRILQAVAAGCCALLVGCDASRAVHPYTITLVEASALASSTLPGSGNGNKEIIRVFVLNTVNCSGTIITRTIEGWIQRIAQDQGSSDMQHINVYRVNYTFTNAAGDTFVARDTGIDQVRMEGAILVLSIAGTTPTHSGLIRINLVTGEQTFEAGQDFDTARNRACAELT